jgi:hypothetical protein
VTKRKAKFYKYCNGASVVWLSLLPVATILAPGFKTKMVVHLPALWIDWDCSVCTRKFLMVKKFPLHILTVQQRFKHQSNLAAECRLNGFATIVQETSHTGSNLERDLDQYSWCRHNKGSYFTI